MKIDTDPYGDGVKDTVINLSPGAVRLIDDAGNEWNVGPHHGSRGGLQLMLVDVPDHRLASIQVAVSPIATNIVSVEPTSPTR